MSFAQILTLNNLKMKNRLPQLFRLLILVTLLVTTDTQAQLGFLPQTSQMATVTQRVGISDISVTYSRPKVNGREIWGEIVPYGLSANNFGTAKEMPWRAGANENTVITLPNDAKIEGKVLAAGTYSLHMIPKASGDVTVIFNRATSSWGSYFYDKSKDVLTVDVKMVDAAHYELLTFEFTETSADGTTLALMWEKKSIPMIITVASSDLVMEKIENELTGSTGFSRESWEQAAGYALGAGKHEQALKWIDAAITGQFFSQKTFQNLGTKGTILNAMGRTAEADALIDESMALANTNQLNTLGYQLLGQKNFKKAIAAFELNVKNNPEDANAYDSLGEGHKLADDKQNAIKALKKSLTLNPAPAVKANSLKLLKELGVNM
ncbi:MAG: Tfp pilus assembly protein PilF [Arcticibacterium sp.]|jgi:Tfp pilus assembly protein PilF